MSSTGFLDDSDLRRLTGRALKSRQIQWLRTEGIPFRINATGHPVVTWAAVEGRQAAAEPPQPQAWTPRVIAGGA
jgi:hypothetical protein